MDLFSAAHSFADFSYSVQIFNRRAQILFIDPTVNHFEQIIFIPHGVFVICSDDHVFRTSRGGGTVSQVVFRLCLIWKIVRDIPKKMCNFSAVLLILNSRFFREVL